MPHTFLFEEGTWKVEGHRDAAGALSPVSGENAIRHEPGVWHFEAALRLRGDPLRVTHNRYQIEPFSPGRPRPTGARIIRCLARCAAAS